MFPFQVLTGGILSCSYVEGKMNRLSDGISRRVPPANARLRRADSDMADAQHLEVDRALRGLTRRKIPAPFVSAFCEASGTQRGTGSPGLHELATSAAAFRR